MNTRLLILAILTIIIAALFMGVSAPAEETVFRMTLGGDCSADRATGDLYHISDRYCIVVEGTGSVPAAPAGRGERVVKRRQSLRQGYVSVIANDRGNDQGDNEGNNGSNAQVDEQPKNDSNNQEDKRGIAASSNPVDEQTRDKSNDSSNASVDEQSKDQDDQRSSDKKCKKAERDNVNSQGNHNCSADNPDTNSGQERSTDHGQSNGGSNAQIDHPSNSQPGDQGPPHKECKNAERDNINSQGNHDCSADHPDTNSDQQHTTDHGNPFDQDQGSGDNKSKEKKDK